MREIIVSKRCTVSSKRESRLCADESCQLLLFLRGDVQIRVNGREYVPEPGDLLLFGSGEVHTLTAQAGSPFERVEVRFDRQFFQRLSDKRYDLMMSFNLEEGSAKSNLIRARFVDEFMLREKLESLYKLYRSEAQESAVLMLSVMLDILVNVNDAHRRQFSGGGGAQEPEGGEKINEVLRYIVNNLQEPFTLDGLAARFYISKYYLCHEFKRAAGVSCLEYIRQKRIEKAREMLLKGRPVNDVWPELGFSDYMSFYRSFKKSTGVSPNEYVWTQTAHGAQPQGPQRRRRTAAT